MKDDVLRNAKSTNSFKSNSSKVDQEQVIQQELDIDKANLRNLFENQDDTLTSNIDALVDIHVNLKKTSEQMTTQSIKASQAICNSQAK